MKDYITIIITDICLIYAIISIIALLTYDDEQLFNLFETVPIILYKYRYLYINAY